MSQACAGQSQSRGQWGKDTASAAPPAGSQAELPEGPAGLRSPDATSPALPLQGWAHDHGPHLRAQRAEDGEAGQPEAPLRSGREQPGSSLCPSPGPRHVLGSRGRSSLWRTRQGLAF